MQRLGGDEDIPEEDEFDEDLEEEEEVFESSYADSGVSESAGYWEGFLCRGELVRPKGSQVARGGRSV